MRAFKVSFDEIRWQRSRGSAAPLRRMPRLSIVVWGIAAILSSAAVDAQRAADEPRVSVDAAEGTKAETCLRERAITDMSIVDDGTILFSLRSGVAYVNALNRLADLVLELPRSCIGLTDYQIRIATRRLGRVCAGDAIEIELPGDEVRPFLPTCRLGVFYRISAADVEELLERRPPPSTSVEPVDD